MNLIGAHRQACTAPAGSRRCSRRPEPTAVSPGVFLLDVGGYTDMPLPQGRNLMAALIRLERSRGRADVDAAGMRAGSLRGGDVAG